MITSASAHLASVCCITVLPLPKGPGMLAVPPWATGKRTSMIRWPVTSGSRGSRRRASGRAKRTGQVCIRRSSRPSSSRPTTSVTPNSPPRISFTRARAASGGATFNEVTLLLADILERPLDTVVDPKEQPRAQFDGQRQAGRFHRLTYVQARGVLVDLDEGGVAVEADDLPDQPLLADMHDVVHARTGHAAGDDRRAGNLDDSACNRHVHPPLTPARLPPAGPEGPAGLEGYRNFT